MQKFEIVMLGNTSVGKTSMLSALSNELDGYNLHSECTLEPTRKEFRLLCDTWNKLLEQVEQGAPFSFVPDDAKLAGSEGFIDHDFEFKVDKEKRCSVTFVDTQGSYTGDCHDELIARANNAFGVFCVIDASILMECPDSKNERWNCPKTVKKILNEIFNDGDGIQPQFVLFVLTKCEKYMKNNKERDKLLKKFHEKYDGMISLLEGSDSPVSSYVLAIQTMKCVSFSHLDDDSGLPVFKVLPRRSLESKDCAYPLVILMKHLIRALDEETTWWDRFREFFGLKKALTDYLDELDDNIDEGDLGLFEELT